MFRLHREPPEGIITVVTQPTEQQPGGPPAGWYADPATGQFLRFWDGWAWTDQTAAFPQTPQQQAAAQPLQDQMSMPAPQRQLQEPSQQELTPASTVQAAPQQFASEPVSPQIPPAAVPFAPSKPKAKMARATLVTLLICVGIIAAAIGGAMTLLISKETAHKTQAQEALDGFLTASTAGDDEWREYANDALLRAVPYGAPLLGDRVSAEALNLTVAYDVGELSFSSVPGSAFDVAWAPVDLTYTYTLMGEEHIATAQQNIWLTRPFYFGDDQPRRSDGGKSEGEGKSEAELSGIGPWRVTSIVQPPVDTEGEDNERWFTTDLVVEATEYSDEGVCYNGELIMGEVSESARVSASTESSCLIGLDGGVLVGADVDSDALVRGFPVINSDGNTRAFPLPELTQLESSMNFQSSPPFQQYYVSTEAGQFVFTTALVIIPDFGSVLSNRLISIQKVGDSE